MNRLTVLAVTGLVALGAFAELRTLTPEEKEFLRIPYTKMTPEQRVRRAELMVLREMIENGGEMTVPGTPKGAIRFVNLQKRVPAASLDKAVDAFSSLMRFDVKIVDDPSCKAELVIRLVEDPAAPTLLVAPEDGWAQINVTKLGDDKTKPAFLAARTRKEMIRAFSFLTAGTSRDIPLYGKIDKPSDLDDVAESGFAMDVVMRSSTYLRGMGVKPVEYATYRELIERGFDIAPTNDYQRAIRAEVKTPATKKIR